MLCIPPCRLFASVFLTGWMENTIVRCLWIGPFPEIKCPLSHKPMLIGIVDTEGVLQLVVARYQSVCSGDAESGCGAT